MVKTRLIRPRGYKAIGNAVCVNMWRNGLGAGLYGRKAHDEQDTATSRIQPRRTARTRAELTGGDMHPLQPSVGGGGEREEADDTRGVGREVRVCLD